MTHPQVDDSVSVLLINNHNLLWCSNIKKETFSLGTARNKLFYL